MKSSRSPSSTAGGAITASSNDPSTLVPTTEVQRADVLDALRGFALLGIFISHVPDFSGYSFLPPEGRRALDHHGLDASLATVFEFLIRGKFFSLFSLLFGIGFAVQIDSANRRSANFNRHFIRRLIALLALGLVHACLWYGDILKDYALIGLLLLPTPRWSTSTLGRAICIVLLLRFVWPMIMWALIPTGSNADPVVEFSSMTNAFYGSDLPAMFDANLKLVQLKALQMIYDGRAVSILGMFLIGSLVGRLRLHQNLAAKAELISWVFRVCAPFGIAGNAVLVSLHASTPDYPPTGRWVFEQCIFAIAVPTMALAYATGFALLWIRGWEAILRAFSHAGRMALSTYVSQTLVGIFLFYGIGLKLGNTIGFTPAILFAVAIFALQCVACRIWLQFFRFGPLEWVWRRATYGTPVAMLRRPEAEAA